MEGRFMELSDATLEKLSSGTLLSSVLRLAERIGRNGGANPDPALCARAGRVARILHQRLKNEKDETRRLHN